MTPEAFAEKMSEIAKDPYDEELAHVDADRLMCSLLRELGYGIGIDKFEAMKKWYA